jgi:HTH-type transcriptional regulator/antitoxin HigA
MAIRELKRHGAKRSSWSCANDSYLDLVKKFPIRPIKTRDELKQAIRVLDELLGRGTPLNEQEQGYFESLGNEIRNYEKDLIQMPKVSGLDVLEHLIEAKDVTLSEVARETGIAVSTLSQILANKRALNLTHIKVLAPYFGVSPEVFV